MHVLRDEPARIAEVTSAAYARLARGLSWPTRALLLCALPLCACPRDEPPARLSPRFEAVARLAAPEGSEAAMTRARELFAPHAAEVERRIEEHQRFETEPLPMAELAPEVVRAFDAVIEARAGGGRLPGDACDARSFDLRQLAHAMIGTAPRGDVRRLDAALWLGARLIEERATLIGAALGIDVMGEAIERLEADGSSPTAGMRALAPVDDFVTVTFAREVLCMHAKIAETLGSEKSSDQLEHALIVQQRDALIAHHNTVLRELERAPRSASGRLAVLERAYEQARSSESELVQALAVSAGLFEDLEEKRARIAAWLARPTVDEPPGTESAGDAPLGDEPPGDEPLVDELPPAEPARVRAEVRVFSRARMADARALRLELEGSGLTLTWQEDPWGFRVQGVAAGSLAAELGFRDGDILRAIGERPASAAHREGQGGVGFLVDGLDGRKIAVELVRDHKPDVLLWELQ